MNIRLKGIGANITTSQTDWYTLPIMLGKTSPQISSCSLAFPQNEHWRREREEDRDDDESWWPVMRDIRLAWRRCWLCIIDDWVVTLLMLIWCPDHVLLVSGGDWWWWWGGREDWAETGHRDRGWPGLLWPQRPLGERLHTPHSTHYHHQSAGP